jgi:hypothetical protein
MFNNRIPALAGMTTGGPMMSPSLARESNFRNLTGMRHANKGNKYTKGGKSQIK